jgi:hypothetical protein
MSEIVKSRIQMFGVWCAIAYLVLLFIGWGATAGFLPPTHPLDDAGQIGHLYHADFTRIRIGMLIVMLAALVFVPFVAVMAQHISRIEGGPGVLTYTFVIGGVGNMMLTFYPAIWWLTAAFRPDRAHELIQLMNDLAWLQFLGGVTIYLAMPLAVMVASLADNSERPTFPRWCGYANGFVALAILPDQLLFFFKDGPFAWNGLFGVWLPIVWFCGFFLVNFFPLRQAILRERSELVPAAAPAPA